MAPGGLGGAHETLDGKLEPGRRTRESSQRVGIQLVGKAVAAEQYSISRIRVNRCHVNGDGVFDADAASELVTARVNRRLFGRQPTHPHPLFSDAVVFAQLAKRPVTQLVRPRVTDVHECRRHDAIDVIGETDRDDRRAHAEVLGILLRVRHDRDVRILNRLDESLNRRMLLKLASDQVN